jgi:hypothetical protein
VFPGRSGAVATSRVNLGTATGTRPAQAASPAAAKGYAATFGDWETGDKLGQYRESYDPATGEYHLAFLQGEGEGWTLFEPTERNFSNYVLAVDARSVSGHEAAGYGLAFHGQLARANERTNARYVFVITPGGYFALYLFTAENAQETIQPWAPSSAIRTGTQSNQLSVTCDGPQIRLAINGEPVGQYTATAFAIGQIGLYAFAPPGSAGVEVAYHDLRLTFLR